MKERNHSSVNLELLKYCAKMSDLKRYILSVHEKNKQQKYQDCTASFAKESHLKRIGTSVHEGKQLFKCQICDKSFAEKVI